MRRYRRQSLLPATTDPEGGDADAEGIKRILSEEELEGVMAHELAHVANRDTLISTIAATISGAIAMLGNMLQWAAIYGGGNSDEEEGGVKAIGRGGGRGRSSFSLRRVARNHGRIASN